jgi:hypothetical protein
MNVIFKLSYYMNNKKWMNKLNIKKVFFVCFLSGLERDFKYESINSLMVTCMLISQSFLGLKLQS